MALLDVRKIRTRDAAVAIEVRNNGKTGSRGREWAGWLPARDGQQLFRSMHVYLIISRSLRSGTGYDPRWEHVRELIC